MLRVARCLHILGGGLWQVPTIRLAKSLGYRVLVTDMYQERPGYAFADAHEVVDITDMEATLRAARQHRIDGIICDTTDVGVPTMAWVAEQMGLAGIGYETALNFTNKHRMRTLTAAAGLPNPGFARVTTAAGLRKAADDLGFPLVVKPVDNQSSRGVFVLRGPGEIEARFAEAKVFSREGALIAEQFLDGTEVTVESCCTDGEVSVIGISDKDHFQDRPTVANRLTYPAGFPPAIMARIRDVNCGVVRALGLRSGVTHAEYMVVGSEVYLVEIAARGGGSHVYSHIVPYLAGIPIPERYVRFVMGEPFAGRPDGVPRAANLAFFDFPAGCVMRIEGLEEAKRLPGVEVLLLEFGVGDRIQRPEDDRSRAGQVVLFGKERSEVLAQTAAVFRTVRVQVAA